MNASTGLSKVSVLTVNKRPSPLSPAAYDSLRAYLLSADRGFALADLVASGVVMEAPDEGEDGEKKAYDRFR